jgi:maleylpyruvate isomerase
VRIVLAFKGVRVSEQNRQLRAGEHRTAAYRRINPQGFVPALELDDGRVLTQSLAILEYLEEVHPSPPLLPADPVARAEVRALCQLIACDVHPLNNLRVLQYLEHTLEVAEPGRRRWYAHWVTEGFVALERWLERLDSRRFCQGEAPTLADACLVPQVFNARRFEVDLEPFPRILAVDAACRALAPFAAAAPVNARA